MARQHTYEAVLELTAFEDLFHAPNLSPMDDRYGNHSGMPALEFIADQIYANGSYRSANVTFVVPGPVARTTDEIRAGVERWASAKALSQNADVRAMRWRGWRSLLLGLVLFAVLIGASQILDNPRGDILDTLSTGLEVAAWVVLWFPLDTLIFSVWQHRVDHRAYSIIGRMEINLVEVALRDSAL